MHSLIKCYDCNNYIWEDTTTEMPVKNSISDQVMSERFCHACADLIEARSRHMTETALDGLTYEFPPFTTGYRKQF